jgi:hypothetical protein
VLNWLATEGATIFHDAQGLIVPPPNQASRLFAHIALCTPDTASIVLVTLTEDGRCALPVFFCLCHRCFNVISMLL